jgi:hypothetical protein
VREDVCRAGAGSSGVARGARVYEKYMEGSSGVDGGCMGPAMPVVCLSIPSAREDMAGGPPAVVPGTGESGAEVLVPAGLGSCTGLYVVVRRIGGEGAGAHVHMADSVAGTNIIERCLCRSGGMWRCRQERSVKTVGSAYVGSNPTPATSFRRPEPVTQDCVTGFMYAKTSQELRCQAATED